jgi:ABC-2 family transporter protein
MTTMLGVEIRRCFHRRLVRWLIAIAVLGCLVTAFIARRAANDDSLTDQFHLVELWVPGGDSILGVGAIFLIIGAVVGGASMIGAEWRAGTLTTLLTWEPNRIRVGVAKLLACGLVAFAVAMVLQVLWCAAFVPTALGPGTTDGVDEAWLRSLGGAMLRIGALIGLTATFMAAIAMIGRNTAAALGVAFGYLMVFENIIHAWKPWATRFLLGPNGAVFTTGGKLDTEEFTRSTTTAGLTLLGYAVAISTVAILVFRRRDLASTG